VFPKKKGKGKRRKEEEREGVLRRLEKKTPDWRVGARILKEKGWRNIMLRSKG